LKFENVDNKLKYFNKNSDGNDNGTSDLNFEECEIDDDILDEINLEWFINKKLFDKSNGLQ